MIKKIACAVAMTLVMTAPALAEPASPELSVSASTMGFSSPNSTYGPWDWGTVSLHQTNGADAYGISFSSRSDRDLDLHTHGNFTEADYMHTWSNRFYSNFSAGVGSGLVYARNSFSGDINMRGENRVWSLGLTHVDYQTSTRSTSLFTGPTFYSPNLNVTLLVKDVMNTQSPSGLGGVADFMYMHHGLESANLALAYQRGQYEALVSGLPPAAANVTSYEAHLSKSFYFNRRSSIKAQLDAVKLNNIQTGHQEFFGRGFSLSYRTQL